MIGNLMHDARYALKSLSRSPGFAAVVILTMALGIGANTAIFSVVNAVLLRPLPYDDPDRLMWLWDTQPQLPEAPASLPDFIDWKDQSQSFEHLAAYQSGNMFVENDSGTQDMRVGLVTPDTFSLFRVKPLLGRTFTEEETRPGRFRVAVLSQSLWQRLFGSDPKAVGRTIRLSGSAYTIIGVIPAGFDFPDEAQLWRPLVIDPNQLDRGPHYLRVVGRLKADVSIAQAQAEMSTIAARLAQQHREKIAGHGVKLEPLSEVVTGDIKPALLVLLGAVGLVLLIACANVANLLLARAGERQKEIAIRMALGANRGRIISQLLTESLLLAVIAGAAGLLAAVWGVSLLVSLNPESIPRVREIGVDAQVAGFTASISLLTGAVFGLAPALQISKPDLTDALKESGRTTAGRRRNRLRSLLVVAEIALSVVLLIGAGLMINSFARLSRVDPGFNPDNLLTMGVTLLRSNYPEEEQVASFYSRLLQRVAAAPRVESAGAIVDLPLSGSNTSTYFTIEGRAEIAKEEQPITECRVVTPHYFEAMEIPLLAGRDFAQTDTKQTPNVAVINEAFARRHFAEENPIGHRIRLQGQYRDPLLIIGVVGDVRDLAMDEEPTPEVYFPFLQSPLSETYDRSLTIVARTKSDLGAIAGALKDEMLALDKSLPVYAIRPMTQYLSDSLSHRRFNLILLSVFAAAALLLAAVGIYGVMSYSVAQQTHAIGIRRALGADTRHILRQIVGQAMRLTSTGISVGLLAAFALTRLMSSLLYGISPTDPSTFAAIALALSAVAIAASYVPARRAMKVDPIVALRYE